MPINNKATLASCISSHFALYLEITHVLVDGGPILQRVKSLTFDGGGGQAMLIAAFGWPGGKFLPHHLRNAYVLSLINACLN